MELLQLVYFCHAAETENFAKTAREYRVPAAGISQSIKRLENEIGASLFDRSANGVKLNERGRILYKNASSALLMLEDAKKKIRDEEISGNIRLLVETNRYIVNEAIRAFREKYKSISFSISYELNNDRDKYDLIITDNVSFKKRYKSYPFLKERILLALPPNHPLAKEERVHVSKLEDEPFIISDPQSGLFTITRRICSCGQFEPKIGITANDPDSLMQYVKTGLGVAIVPEFSWHPLFSENILLKELDGVKDEYKTRPSLILCHTEKYASRATRLFIDELTKTAEQLSLF
ncbi:MAG: LysR family transcriptional regulator [Ruminococcaceae bacterium]|nr:LysR family transcriptional regulator [Oscillospiraceae bacterium]